MFGFIARRASRAKEILDMKITKQRGGFNNRTRNDLKNIFGIDFKDLRTTKELEMEESRLDRIPQASQEFLLNCLYKYNLTYIEDQRIKRDFDGFKGNEENMGTIVEFFLRSIIVSCYEEGVCMSKNDEIVMEEGTKKGKHDLVIYRGGFPSLVVRFAVKNNQLNGIPLEQAFCNNVFEVYSTYWKNPVWPLYGCITDLNNWIFIKYDGKDIFRSHKVFKFALHNTAILSLANKILNIIDKGVL